MLAGCAELSESITRPQRPTVSSDTNTTRAGHLELEAGGDVDPGDFFTTPVTLKSDGSWLRPIEKPWVSASGAPVSSWSIDTVTSCR